MPHSGIVYINFTIIWQFLLKSNKYRQNITTTKAQKVPKEVNIMKIKKLENIVVKTEVDKRLIELFRQYQPNKLTNCDYALKELLTDKSAVQWTCDCGDNEHNCTYMSGIGPIRPYISNRQTITYTTLLGEHFHAIARDFAGSLQEVMVIGPDINTFMGFKLHPDMIHLATVWKDYFTLAEGSNGIAKEIVSFAGEQNYSRRISDEKEREKYERTDRRWSQGFHQAFLNLAGTVEQLSAKSK